MSSTTELNAGTLLAERYEVLAKIGSGSFSSVYRVLDRSSGRECALKLLEGWQQADGQLLQRLQREFLLGRRIEHPGCCRLFDLVERHDVVFMTMELIRGLRLDEVLASHLPLTISKAIHLAAQAASSVAALHRVGIVHRDLKAQNIILAEDGQLKLMDLGFSWSAEVASLTASGAILGTPTHMAPEYLLTGEFSLRTDVYALGVLAYQLLTGRLPLVAPNLRALVKMVLEDGPAAAITLRPDVPVSADALIMRCLAKQASDRPPDAMELETLWGEVPGAHGPLSSAGLIAGSDRSGQKA